MGQSAEAGRRDQLPRCPEDPNDTIQKVNGLLGSSAPAQVIAVVTKAVLWYGVSAVGRQLYPDVGRH
jgi:hypothetical protein